MFRNWGQYSQNTENREVVLYGDYTKRNTAIGYFGYGMNLTSDNHKYEITVDLVGNWYQIPKTVENHKRPLYGGYTCMWTDKTHFYIKAHLLYQTNIKKSF